MTIARRSATRAIKGAQLVLGAWLFVSAYLLRHSSESFLNTWTMGVLTAIAAAVALLGIHVLVRVAGVFAVWLFVSTLIVPYASTVTQLHNGLVAIALFILAVVPSRYLERGEGQEPERATA